MSQEVFISQKRVIDFDDKVATALINLSTSGTLLTFANGQTFFNTRVGKRGRLTFVGNSVDPGAESKITFHVLVNGARALPPYDAFTQAMGETFDGTSRMAVPIDLPQGALVQVTADNSDSATNWNAYIRIRVEYEDF